MQMRNSVTPFFIRPLDTKQLASFPTSVTCDYIKQVTCKYTQHATPKFPLKDPIMITTSQGYDLSRIFALAKNTPATRPTNLQIQLIMLQKPLKLC